MATNYNITMKRYNGTDYDVLYPRTLPSQIDGGVYTKDEATGLFLSKTGGQMSGLLDMNGNKISNLAAPTAANDAATKYYVDNNSYMWNKVLLGTFTESGTIVNISTDNFENLIGLYEESQFTITSASKDGGEIYLIQDVSDFPFSSSYSGSIYYIACKPYVVGTYENKNYTFFMPMTYYGEYDYSMKSIFSKRFMSTPTVVGYIYYYPSSATSIKFILIYGPSYSNVNVKLYGLYGK